MRSQIRASIVYYITRSEFGLQASVLPELIEPLRRELRVRHGVLDRSRVLAVVVELGDSNVG